ncbi:MAG: energy-coupled thiamine transporter ThiT [Clostridia bacterium]|nr:energy-coupled thiamine transporter ThiT [Clostridia bacterium]
MKENKKRVEAITLSSIMIAFAISISAICAVMPFLNLPFGGGFTIASMLPIIVIAYMYGTKWGLLTAFVYSIMQMLLGFNTVSAFFLPGDSQMLWYRAIIVCLIDYVIAYTVLGFGGIFRNKFGTRKALVLGSIFAISLRYIAHIVSGAIFFGTWAEWFFTQDGFPAWGEKILEIFSGGSLATVYSIIYNGTYMIPEIIITAIVACFVTRIPQIKMRDEV